MGARGFNAGGFAYMDTVACPKCGVLRKLGHEAISDGRTKCGDAEKCKKRELGGKYLHRIGAEVESTERPHNGAELSRAAAGK